MARMKRATFRDAQVLAQARSARRKAKQPTAGQTMTRPRTKTIDGYQIQPMLPLHVSFGDGRCIDADFTEYEGKPCVEALVHIGLIKGPYTLVLSIEQALDADIIERT